MANNIEAVKQLQKEIDKFTSQLVAVNNEIIKISKSTREVSDGFRNIKTPNKVNDSLKKTAGNIETINALYKQQDSLEKNLINTQAKQKLAVEGTNKAYIKSRFELQQQNKLVKDAAVLGSNYANLLQKTIVLRNREAKTIQNLNLKKELGNKLSNKEQSELKQSVAAFNKYDSAIRKANTSVGRFQQNVGNYPKGMAAAAGAARNLASAMGLVGGAFLAVSVIKDAFKRIREFDKTMQNLSGILRVSRKDIKDLEKEIVSVAKTSVRTTTEVAKLAESLITLGKSKEEVKQLISPVTDLSLGLGVAADEAGEFLVQMLNTFGASTDEAAKYADTIATIRTSTSLDFQKMRDSFQYLAPISKALNKDLAYTGAVIGILADNGLKAESSGRLLGTAIQKLAAKGKTLTEALNEITEAQKKGIKEEELLTIATDLFGVQAAKVGLILANNSKIIDTNAQAIRDNGGALDDLVNEQMESLDSKLKLLDSAWEGLITTVDNGKGSFSGVFKSLVDGATFAINALTKLEEAQSKVFEATGQGKGVLGYLKNFTGLNFNKKYDELIDLQSKFNEQNKNLDKLSLSQVRDRLKEVLSAQILIKDKSGELNNVYQQQAKEIQKVLNVRQQERDSLEKEAIALGYNTSLEGEYVKAKKQSTYILTQYVKENKKSEEQEGKTTDSTDKSTESKKRRNKATALSIDLEKERNKQLKVAQDSLSALKDNFKDDDSFKLNEIDQTALDDFVKEIDEKVYADIKIQIAKDDIQDGLGELAGTIEEFTDISGDKFLDFYDKISEGGEKTFEDLADIAASSFSLASDVSGAFFQSKIDGYEADIEANNEYYANLLENENLSDEEKDRLEADRKNKEKKLREEQAKEKEKQFQINKLFRIGEIIADTASAIVKTGASLGYPAAIPFQIQAGILGAAQLAIVAAQSPPKFAEGGVMGYDGDMIINDHHTGRLELVERKGKLLMTDKKNARVEGKKGDIIHKDASEYFKNKSDGELIKNIEMHSVLASINRQNIYASRLDNKKTADLHEISADRIVKAIKSQKTKFNLTQNINLADDLRYLDTKNNML